MPPRRKKTAIACVNCSKAHVTCEEKRPCSRCVRKNMEFTCINAPRKRKKYLADVPEEHLPVPVKKPPLREHQEFHNPQHIVHKPKFLSSAADLEYSILSDIIHQDTLLNKIPVNLLYSTGSHENLRHYNNASSHESTPAPIPSPLHPHQMGLTTKRSNPNLRTIYSSLLGPQSSEIVASDINLFTTHFPLQPQKAIDGTLDFKRFQHQLPHLIKFDKSINQYYLNTNSSFPEVWETPTKKSGPRQTVSFSLEVTPPDTHVIQNNCELPHSLRYKTPMEIYTLISQPFSHTSGFHSLLTYLRRRFNKRDLVEMCRSLAEFRPIFIACSVTLTEEDMIFMEQSYQRTLLEYDKFISQIGTPTCVWRRNGQISYVNDEFSLLTGWTRDELLNKMTFIVELMDDDSVREYFKTFSRVAYRDFKGCEKMKKCSLLSPIKEKIIRCRCMWTLKRDVFGLPLMIIGNFMPILVDLEESEATEGGDGDGDGDDDSEGKEEEEGSGLD